MAICLHIAMDAHMELTLIGKLYDQNGDALEFPFSQNCEIRAIDTPIWEYSGAVY